VPGPEEVQPYYEVWESPPPSELQILGFSQFSKPVGVCENCGTSRCASLGSEEVDTSGREDGESFMIMSCSFYVSRSFDV
jgi:hypothetical protein